MPHVIWYWPLIAYIFSLSSSLFTWICEFILIENFLYLSLRNSKSISFKDKMQLLTSIISIFSQRNYSDFKISVNPLRRSSNLLWLVSQCAFFLVFFKQSVNPLSANLLYSCYWSWASTTSELIYYPFSFFSFSFAIKSP